MQQVFCCPSGASHIWTTIFDNSQNQLSHKTGLLVFAIWFFRSKLSNPGSFWLFPMWNYKFAGRHSHSFKCIKLLFFQHKEYPIIKILKHQKSSILRRIGVHEWTWDIQERNSHFLAPRGNQTRDLLFRPNKINSQKPKATEPIDRSYGLVGFGYLSSCLVKTRDQGFESRVEQGHCSSFLAVSCSIMGKSSKDFCDIWVLRSKMHSWGFWCLRVYAENLYLVCYPGPRLAFCYDWLCSLRGATQKL